MRVTAGCLRVALAYVNHPGLARLTAYACLEVDADLEVGRHLGECVACTDFVVAEMLRLPITPENCEQLALQGRMARSEESDP
jgi:hypothetical protein